MNIFQGIIDIYDENAIDLRNAFDLGIRLIIHQTGQGLYKTDQAYGARKREALNIGFLWGAYHFLSSEDTEAQLNRFLSIEDGSDPRIGLAIDWEPSAAGTMSYPELQRFVRLFNEKMRPRYADRYPLLYSGNLFRDTAGIVDGDPLLAKCPLWYARYTNGALQIPSKTWTTYTLWQFDDEKREFGAPPPGVLRGADFNRFQGTIDDLRRGWPFTGPAGAGAPTGVTSFADLAVGKAAQEWKMFGEQTYDLNGDAIRVGHKEGEVGFFDRVGTYWTRGVNMPGIDGRNHDQPWSAAFISFIMKEAGAGDRFHYNAQHSVYISQAIRDFLQRNQAAGYWGCRLNEAQPTAGDIVCWARQAGIDYDHQNGGHYLGHCDLVVAVNDGQADVIGGNVGDSVTKRPLALNQNGFLQPTTQHGEVLFAIMQNRIASPAAVPPIA